MNGVDILVDSNIFIYWLNGNEKAAEILAENNICFSIITEIEVKGHASNLDTAIQQKLAKQFSRFTRVELSEEVKELAIQYKIQFHLKTPDAIICASARHLNIPLLTADRKASLVDKIVTVLFSPV